MADGVTLTAPETVFFALDTEIGRDVMIGPIVVFGPGVTVETGADDPRLLPPRGRHVSRGAMIGPYARLRPGADIGEDAHIGNFVEVKKANVGEGAKANHLTYLGDGRVGARRQHRRRHHLLQLRRLRQAPDPHRRGRLHRLQHRAGRAGHRRRRRARSPPGSVITEDVPAGRAGARARPAGRTSPALGAKMMRARMPGAKKSGKASA